LGQRDLVKLLRDSGADSPERRARIAGLTSTRAVGQFKNFLDTPDGKTSWAAINTPQFLDALTSLEEKLEMLDETERQNVRVNEELTRIGVQQLSFARSRAGGATLYGKAVIQVLEARDEAGAQNAPPDVTTRLTRDTGLALLQKDFQAGKLTVDEYKGKVLGQSLFNARSDRQSNATAVRYVLGQNQL